MDGHRGIFEATLLQISVVKYHRTKMYRILYTHADVKRDCTEWGGTDITGPLCS